MGQARYFPSDAAVADDTERLIAKEGDVELLPARGCLLANQAPQIFREEEHGGDGEFGQRGTENASAVGERDGAFDQLGRQNFLDAGRQGVDPFRALGQRQDGAQRRAIVEAVEDHVGFGSVLFQEIEIVSGVHRHGLRETVQEAQERIVRARNDEKRDGVHETRKITQAC